MEWWFVILIFWILGGLGAQDGDAYILWTIKVVLGLGVVGISDPLKDQHLTNESDDTKYGTGLILRYSWCFERNHNPRVGGSSPSSATKIPF